MKISPSCKNKLVIQAYQDRIDYCKSKRLIIIKRRAGYEFAYNVYYNGTNLTPGACYDEHENALQFAEDYIIKNLTNDDTEIDRSVISD